MGLLQRFARPEYQAQQPADEREQPGGSEDVSGYEASPPAVNPQSTEAAPQPDEANGHPVNGQPLVPPQAPPQSAPPPQPVEEETMRVIAFANQKGGVAKTTSTLN